MPTNHWDLLMGSQKQTGHCAENYSLEDFSELVHEYDRFLAVPLNLSAPSLPTESNESQEILRIREENLQLREQIRKLINLLTEKLP